VVSGLDLGISVLDAIKRSPTVEAVRLAGSRARGEATELSDWDFEVKTSDFASVAEALPALAAPLEPLAQQWDRLSDHACYMLILRGTGKVDLIFEAPWEPSPPWEVSAETLRGIDDHFWDWTIWLAAKDRAGKRDVLASELGKMHEHLLGPLGVPRVRSSVAESVVAYTAARAEAEQRLGIAVPRTGEEEVRGLLATGEYVI